MLLAKIAILLLWLGAIIDPIGNTFGIRYFALAASFAGLAWLLSTGSLKSLDKSSRGLLILLLAGVFPIYGLLLYSFRTSGNEFIDTSYIASGVLILTSLLYYNKHMCDFGIKAFLLSTRILSLIVMAGFVSQIFYLGDWLRFFTERGVAVVSFREYSGIVFPYLYFLASPLLILLMAYDFGKFRQKNSLLYLLLFFFTALSFALTGTRAHMILALAFAPVYMLLTATARDIIKPLILITLLALIVLSTEEVRYLIKAFFSPYDVSNAIRLSILRGYAEIFSDPAILFLGQGFNAHEWSSPLREMIAMEIEASKTEFTYLELVRVFGIVIASLFIFALVLLLKSTKRLGNDLQWVYPGLAVLLVNAAIQPYLFSVNGILPLGLVAAITLYHRKCYPRPP